MNDNYKKRKNITSLIESRLFHHFYDEIANLQLSTAFSTDFSKLTA